MGRRETWGVAMAWKWIGRTQASGDTAPSGLLDQSKLTGLGFLAQSTNHFGLSLGALSWQPLKLLKKSATTTRADRDRKPRATTAHDWR